MKSKFMYIVLSVGDHHISMIFRNGEMVDSLDSKNLEDLNAITELRIKNFKKGEEMVMEKDKQLTE